MIIAYRRWEHVPKAEWPAKYFTPKEVACRHTGIIHVDREFLLEIDDMREEAGFPFPVNSFCRDVTHPKEVTKPRPGAHTKGLAIDIGVYGAKAHRLVKLAMRREIIGIGVYQRLGSLVANRWIHLDRYDDPDVLRPTIWSD